MQFLWGLALVFFIVTSYMIIKTFTNLPFNKKYNFIFEILLCLIVFSYMLAFRVNF